MIQLAKGQREVFWDNYLIDESKTTAYPRLHHFTRQEIAFVCDEMWEGDSCIYFNAFQDGNIYRMYYLGVQSMLVHEGEGASQPIYACYAESRDGIHWTKPNLGIFPIFDGSYENNVIMDDRFGVLDNFFVFRDDNPNCPPEEKYKAVVRRKTGKPGLANDSLWCYISADAIHFSEGWLIHPCGAFDSLNTAIWDEKDKKYRCWFRGFHGAKDWCITGGLRDIRYMESPDFKNWSEEKRIEINSPYDFQLYTNNMMRYRRADNIFVGFPTRYYEREAWTANYDRLCGKANRKKRMEKEARIGLAITDCMFMTSRDGFNWERWDKEALIVPGEETRDNWVYGDGYLSYGLLETEGEHGKEFSLYLPEGHFVHRPARLRRLTMRLDGFMSYRGDFDGATLVTKPFTFAGEELEINFKTSAAGGLYFSFLKEDGTPIEGYQSCEIFGDTTERIVDFPKPLKELQGKTVRMEIKLSDADIFSFRIR